LLYLGATMTYLTVPISAGDVAGAMDQVAAALEGGAEMLELRTDYLEGLKPEMAVELLAAVRSAGPGVPVIVTCRDPREGGANDYGEDLRIRVLVAAMDAGAEYIDIEYANFTKPEIRGRVAVPLAWGSVCRLIVSAHDFTGRFENARQLYGDIVEACPDGVPKLVYTAGHINDSFDAIDLLDERRGDCIALCMGPAGQISRVLPRKMGGLVTFASLDESSGTAPGQVTLAQMKELYRHDGIDADTELFNAVEKIRKGGRHVSPILSGDISSRSRGCNSFSSTCPCRSSIGYPCC